MFRSFQFASVAGVHRGTNGRGWGGGGGAGAGKSALEFVFSRLPAILKSRGE